MECCTTSQVKESRTLAQEAVELGRAGCSCSQAVLLAMARRRGWDEAEALRTAAGLAGGMGRGEVCGAVSAGVLILGRVLGSGQVGDGRVEMRMRLAVEELMERFSEAQGSILCRELTAGINLKDFEATARLRQSGRPEVMIATVAGIVEDMLREAH